jgi:hypothetical protein
MHDKTMVSISDLRYVCIKCPQCQTRVILDMQKKSAKAQQHGFFAPKQCPGCLIDYDSSIRKSVDELQESYPRLLEIAESVSFFGESEPKT